MKKTALVTVILATLVVAIAQAQTTYFLVARSDPNFRTDSYILSSFY